MSKKKNNLINTNDIGEMVKKFAEYGLNNIEISELTEIPESTLRRKYGEFLAKGRANVKMKLRKKQLAVAMNGNVTMLIWLGKNILGQKENPEDSDELKITVVREEIKNGNKVKTKISRKAKRNSIRAEEEIQDNSER